MGCVTSTGNHVWPQIGSTGPMRSQPVGENCGQAFLSLLDGEPPSPTWNCQGHHHHHRRCHEGDAHGREQLGQELVEDGLHLIEDGLELYRAGQQLIRHGDVADGERLESLGEQLESEGLGLVVEGISLEISIVGLPGRWRPIDPLPVCPMQVGAQLPIYQPV